MIPSLPNTLRRCHSTVRGLRNSWAPISGFVCPVAASLAIWSSCGVRSSIVSTLRLRTVSPVASSSRRARSAKASMPASIEDRVRGTELLAGVDAAALAPQPLAVDELRAAERHADAGAAEPFDRLAVEPLGGVPVTEHRSRAGVEPERPVGVVRLGDLRQQRGRARAARSGLPLWTAASTRSASSHIGVPRPCGSSAARSAAARASS